MLVSYLTATVIALALLGKLHNVNGQTQCTSGFPTLTMPTGSPRSFGATRIIPEMTILCSGRITSWTLAGRSQTSTNGMFPKLKVFRERSSGVYSFVNETELGKCGSGVAEMNANNFFTCNLPESDRLSVEQNDIIGIFSPIEDQAAFEIYFTTTSRPVNYIYMMDVTSEVSVTDRDGMAINTPQINLEITTGSDATTSVSTLPITTTGHGSSTTTNSDISVTTSHLVMTESTTDNNIMPQATNNDVTENDTIFIVTLPPTVTVQITTVIVAVLVTTAVAILVIVVTIMVICLNYRCKKKTHHILVNTLPDEPLHQSHQNEGAHFNACNPINESEEQTNSDQRCHLNHDNIEAGDQVHDLSAANFKTEVRYEQVKLNRNQHYNMMALTLKKEEIEAGYEQVPAENRSNKKELQSDSSLPLDHQYAIPTGGTETVGTTTVEQQQQGGNTRYDTIATYQKAAVYERATTYQKVATYERAVTYEKVPMTTHTMID